MEFSLLLNTIKSGWSIVYIEGSQVTGYCFQKNSLFLLLKINFVKLNSADPDEMWHFIWVYTVCRSTLLEFGV